MSDWTAETAEWYADKYGEYPTNRLAIDALELTPDWDIVDVGCGTGAALRHVASRGPSGTLIGVDPVPRMIEIARERTSACPSGARIHFREGPAESLPVDDASADVVLAFDSFDHWRDQSRGMAEVRRVLRPHGKLVVVKDAAVPAEAEARRAFLDQLVRCGFSVLKEEYIEAEEVSFTMWICGLG